MQTVRDIVAETLHNVVDPLVYDEAVSLIEEHHLAGRDVIIVSASGTEVVEPIGEMLGADGVVATQMEIVDGRYTGEIDYYAYGENKAAALRRLAEEHHYDLSRSYAYSDSVTDLHMLEAVGHPFAVNPDRELRRQADARGWPVLVFTRRWRCAAGCGCRRASRTLAALALGTAAAVGGAVYVAARRGRPRHAERYARPDPSSDALVGPPSERRTKGTTTQDPHMSQVPTRRTTLPIGRCPSGSPGATVKRCTPGSHRSHVSAAAPRVLRTRSAACMSRALSRSRRAGSPRRPSRRPRRRTAARRARPAAPPSR